MKVTSTKHITSRRQHWVLKLGYLALILMTIIYCISKLVLSFNTRKWLKLYLSYYFHSSNIFFCKIFYEIFPLALIKYPITKFGITGAKMSLLWLVHIQWLIRLLQYFKYTFKAFELCISPRHVGLKWLLTELTHELVFSNNLILLKAHFQLVQVEYMVC